VLFWSQSVGLLAMMVYAIFFAPELAPQHDLIFGFLGGTFGFIGIALQYRALSIGPMRVVAPTSAILAASLPVAVSLIQGDPLSLTAGIGIALCLAAIVTLGLAENGEQDQPVGGARPSIASGPVLAMGAGLAFGAFFVVFGELDNDSGLWPVVVDRAASVVLAGAVLMWSALTARRKRSLAPAGIPATPVTPHSPSTQGRAHASPIRFDGHTVAILLTCGTLDVSAHAIYVIAARRGLTSEIAVLASLYPAATVILAVLVLREAIRRPHLAGFALAAMGVALIASG
jgi:drug/metabolite transporter (DMT)-like permease